MDDIGTIIEKFLSVYWLRPEVAVWRTLDVLQSRNKKIFEPSIDLGCGDGLFSFIKLQGKINLEYDVFLNVKSTTKFFKGNDIYDNSRMFVPRILKKPLKKFTIGVDWKKSLLDKAKPLHLYEKLIRHNLNKPLPLKDSSFKTIFSNVFYWIDDVNSLISESSRILQKKGKLIVFLPDLKFQKSLIYNQYLKEGHDWARILDRGNYKILSKHCNTFSNWKKLFLDYGFIIDSHSEYLSEKFMQFWNIGLRPYSPFLIEMANKLSINDRVRIKRKLVKELKPLLTSYVNYEMKRTNNHGHFHMFVLSKK